MSLLDVLLLEQCTRQMNWICSCIFAGEILVIVKPFQVSGERREQMAMSVERLNQSGERIKDSRRILLETEELGISIVEDLHQQRETLLHSRNKVLLIDLFPFGFCSIPQHFELFLVFIMTIGRP